VTEQITERPFNPRYLFNTGPNTAELESNFGDKGAYVHGFLDAARHLALRLEANLLGVDIVVYPAIYLLRRGLELGFKAILARITTRPKARIVLGMATRSSCSGGSSDPS
jgi:hypothetical protein